MNDTISGAETYPDVSNPAVSMMPTEDHDLDCDYTTLAVMQQRREEWVGPEGIITIMLL